MYWVRKGPKFGGVSLDVDCVSEYGPETLTFGGGVRSGDYEV